MFRFPVKAPDASACPAPRLAQHRAAFEDGEGDDALLSGGGRRERGGAGGSALRGAAGGADRRRQSSSSPSCRRRNSSSGAASRRRWRRKRGSAPRRWACRRRARSTRKPASSRSIVVRQGEPVKAIADLLKEREEYRALVLGAAADGGPGPLVEHFSGRGGRVPALPAGDRSRPPRRRSARPARLDRVASGSFSLKRNLAHCAQPRSPARGAALTSLQRQARRTGGAAPRERGASCNRRGAPRPAPR